MRVRTDPRAKELQPCAVVHVSPELVVLCFPHGSYTRHRRPVGWVQKEARYGLLRFSATEVLSVSKVSCQDLPGPGTDRLRRFWIYATPLAAKRSRTRDGIREARKCVGLDRAKPRNSSAPWQHKRESTHSGSAAKNFMSESKPRSTSSCGSTKNGRRLFGPMTPLSIIWLTYPRSRDLTLTCFTHGKAVGVGRRHG